MAGDSLIKLLEERMKKYRLPLMPVIWGMTCVLIALLVAIGIRGYRSAEKAIAYQFNSQQLMLAGQAAQGMENYLQEIREAAALLTRLPEMQNPGEQDGSIRAEAVRSFYERFGGKVNFLFLTDAAGRLTAAYPRAAPKIIGRDFQGEEWFQRAQRRGRTVVKSMVPGERRRSPSASFGSILVAAPLSQGGRFGGVLGCGIDFRLVHHRFFQPLRPGVTSGSWMINQEGIFVSHYDASLVGRNAFTVRREHNPDSSPEHIDWIMRERMLRGEEGMEEYTTTWDWGGRGHVRRLIAFAPVRVDEEIWSIAVAAPYSDVTRVVWASFRNSALLLGVMAFLLVAGTYIGHKINQGRIRAEEKVRWGEEIARGQNRLQALFDGAPDAITMVDRFLRISLVNKTGLTWYNRPLEEFTGKLCYEVFQGRNSACPNCPAEESFRTGQPAFRDRASLVAGGKKHYLRLYAFPLKDLSGEVVGVAEYAKDVTEEAQLQQQIIQSERLAVVGRMSANVAHEIKNPLGTIVLNAELLEEELDRFAARDTAEARDLLGVIKAELDRLIEVVEEYLQFARLPKVRLEEGDLNGVISDLLDFLREEASGRQVEMITDLAPLPAVALDPRQMRQALLNILKNSFEAMPRGGKLAVTTVLKEDQVEVTFADTGKGISEEHLDLIFTPFFSTKQGGTGLGLSITAHIVQEHHGNITFTSEPDLGTVFTIRLPVLRGAASGAQGPVRRAGLEGV